MCIYNLCVCIVCVCTCWCTRMWAYVRVCILFVPARTIDFDFYICCIFIFHF